MSGFASQCQICLISDGTKQCTLPAVVPVRELPSDGPEFPVSVEKGVGETRMTRTHSQSKPDSHRAPVSELRLQTKNLYAEVMGRYIFKGENVCQSICLSRAAFSCIPAERSGAGDVVRYPCTGAIGSPLVGIVPGLSLT